MHDTVALNCGAVRRFIGDGSSGIGPVTGVLLPVWRPGQKSLSFELGECAGFIEALFTHHERQNAAAISGLEVGPCAGVELEAERTLATPAQLAGRPAGRLTEKAPCHRGSDSYEIALRSWRGGRVMLVQGLCPAFVDFGPVEG